MRLLCRHGHFAFYPKAADDIGRFTTYFDIELIRVDDYYTFPLFEDAPQYSLLGKPYLGLPAVALFEGKPWEVMKENGFVYSLSLKRLIPKLAVINVVTLPQTGYAFSFNGFIQPGTRTPLGRQILSYDAEFLLATFSLRVSRVSYE